MGRTNKLVDGCYSYWVGALFPLLASLQQGQQADGGSGGGGSGSGGGDPPSPPDAGRQALVGEGQPGGRVTVPALPPSIRRAAAGAPAVVRDLPPRQAPEVTPSHVLPACSRGPCNMSCAVDAVHVLRAAGTGIKASHQIFSVITSPALGPSIVNDALYNDVGPNCLV